jgi:predicted RNA-binding protein with TRAM domain
VELSNTLLCLFSTDVSEEVDGHVVEVPRREVESGDVAVGDTYRVALIEPEETDSGRSADRNHPRDEPQPPVEPGEIRFVEIEDLGKQGDGIARVERGYVIIVPETEVGDRVKLEITEVKSNFAVGEVLEQA